VITNVWLVIYIYHSAGEYRTKKRRRQAKKTLTKSELV